MFSNQDKIKTFALLMGTLLIPGVTVYPQNGTTIQQTAALSLLDSTRERDGLFGSVRRVKVQTARLETKSGRSIEGPLQLQEITTYSVSGDRIENVSYPVAITAVGKEEYKYNERGQIVEMTLRGDDGAILSRERYDYEFDDFGNWTRMVTSLVVFEGGELKFEPVEVTYRSLAYYFNDTVAEIVGSGSLSVLAPPTARDTANLSSAVEKPSNQLMLPNQPASSTEVAMRVPFEPQPRETEKSVSGSEASESRNEGVNATSAPLSSVSDVDYASFSPKAFSKRKENGPEALPVERSVRVDDARRAESKDVVDRSGSKQNEKTPKATTELKSVPANLGNAKAGKAAPGVSAEVLKAFDLYKAGRQHFDSGQVTEAIDAYQQSIKLEPKSAEVHLSLGHAYLRLKQDPQAIRSFKQATTLNPELAEAFYGLGLSYFNLRRHREAAKAFKEATVVRPSLAKAHYGLALAYQELGDEEGVLTEFRLLETLDSGLAKKLADTFPEFNLPCRVPPYCK